IVTPDTNTTRSLMSGAQEQFTKLFNLQELANSLAGLLPTATGTSAASVLANLLSNPWPALLSLVSSGRQPT
ncbi:hypothetical protein BOX15_Mlig007002g5, partial [Macrostomum lignano]